LYVRSFERRETLYDAILGACEHVPVFDALRRLRIGQYFVLRQAIQGRPESRYDAAYT
jgi:hypothetical protein